MKLFTAAMLITLALTTGFSCERNAPPEPQTEMAPPAQDQMGAPADGTDAAPPEPSTTEPGAPAEGTSTTNQ